MKRIFLGIFYIAALYAALIYARPAFIFFIIQKFSKITYIDDVTLSLQSVAHMVLMAYSFVSFFWTRKTLKMIDRQTPFFWIINWALDFIFIPLSVLIMVLYYNQKLGPVNLSLVENMFLMGLLLIIKHFILVLIVRKDLVIKKL